MLPLKRVRAMSASSDDELDDFQIRFQEAHGSRLFRQGKPRALLEVKSPAFSALSRASFLAPSKSWRAAHPGPSVSLERWSMIPPMKASRVSLFIVILGFWASVPDDLGLRPPRFFAKTRQVWYVDRR